MDDVQFALQVLVAGLARGSVIGLVAIGIVVVFTTTRLLNFAAGEFVMVSGIFGWLFGSFFGSASWWLGLIFAIISGAVYAVCVERIVIRPLRIRGTVNIAIVIALLGVSIVTAQTVQIFAGPGIRSVPSPWRGGPFRLGEVVIPRHTLLTIIAVAITVVVFMLIRQRTNLGLALRVVGGNRDGARVIGLNVGRIETLTFALAGAAAGVAGMLITPISGWQPTMGLPVAIMAFIAAIVGGISNPLAAFAGAMLIGIAGVVIEVYVSPLYSSAILFVVLIVVVLIRPAGLIPSRETEDGPLRA